MHARIINCEDFVLSNTVCPDLTAPANGRVVVNGRRTGDTAEYSCVGEYELVGDQTRTCMSNSQWSGQTPSCQLSPGNELHVYLLQVTKQLTCMKCACCTCNCYFITVPDSPGQSRSEFVPDLNG